MKDKLYLLLFSFFATFAPLVPLLLSIGILIVIDFFVGLYRAYKSGELITSRKMSNTISKMLLYNFMIVSLFILETFIIDKALPLTKIGAGFIAIIEVKSINESVQLITGTDILGKVIGMIKRTEDVKGLLEKNKEKTNTN
jgi:hypothetical protein